MLPDEDIHGRTGSLRIGLDERGGQWSAASRLAFELLFRLAGRDREDHIDMINNQQQVILKTEEARENNPAFYQTPASKPTVQIQSSVDSDVSDRRDVREALYSGIFRRHRKTILALGEVLFRYFSVKNGRVERNLLKLIFL